MMASMKILSMSFLICTVVSSDEFRNDGCRGDQECISLKSCRSVFNFLEDARDDPSTSNWRKHIIHSVKERICGLKQERRICCPRNQEKENVKIGSFQTKLYGVTGDVFIMDSQSFLIRNFKYSGEGPDGIITGGFSGEPNNNPDVIFSFPFSGKFSLHLEDGKSETIDRFDGQRDLLLTLPDGINAFQLKWISVWCRDFGVNFGHAILQHRDQYS